MPKRSSKRQGRAGCYSIMWPSTAAVLQCKVHELIHEFIAERGLQQQQQELKAMICKVVCLKTRELTSLNAVMSVVKFTSEPLNMLRIFVRKVVPDCAQSTTKLSIRLRMREGDSYLSLHGEIQRVCGRSQLCFLVSRRDGRISVETPRKP